jgi:predicted MFS family arabinose efflux permease
VGLAAPEEDRGTAFGILGMTNGLGGLLGGLSMGYIADHLGYVGVFSILAGFSLLIMVGGLLSPTSPSVLVPQEMGSSARGEGRVGLSLVFLLVAMLLASLANATGSLGRSFLMAEDKFSKSTITLTAAIQGVAGIVLPFLLGRLADRIGRRWVMISSISITAASLVLLGLSHREWQYYLFATLFGFLTVATAMAPAHVVDVESRNVGRNVSLVQSAFWVGSIFGMAATGVVAARVGTSRAVLLSCAFPAAAALLLLYRREAKKGRETSLGADR